MLFEVIAGAVCKNVLEWFKIKEVDVRQDLCICTNLIFMQGCFITVQSLVCAAIALSPTQYLEFFFWELALEAHTAMFSIALFSL